MESSLLLIVAIGVLLFFGAPLLYLLYHRLNADVEAQIERWKRERELKRTGLVDLAIARALQLDPYDLRNYARRNAEELLRREEEILKRAREVLEDSAKVRMLWEHGALEPLLQDVFALKEAKRYVARNGRFRERCRREVEEAKLLALRKRLIERYGLSPGRGRSRPRLPTDLKGSNSLASLVDWEDEGGRDGC